MATKESLKNDSRAPSALQKIISLKIERLGDDSRRVLQSAATIGTCFEYKLLKELLGPVSKKLLDSSLKALERHDLVFERSKFPKRRFEFRNETIRGIIYNLIPQHKKTKIHSRIACFLENLYKDNIEENIESLVYHFQRSDNPESAVKYSFRYGEILFEKYRLHEALNAFIFTLDLLDSLEFVNAYDIAKKILKYKWEIYLLLGNYDLAFNAIDSLKGILKRGDLEEALDIKRLVAEILVEKGEFERAEKLLSEVGEVARAKKYEGILVKTLKSLGFISIFREDIDHTKKICEEGLFLADESDVKTKSQFLVFLGFTEYYRNRYVNALAYFNKILDLLGDIEDRAIVGKVHCNIGMVHFKRGKYQEALNYYLTSLDILKNIEYQRATAITRMNLAVLYDHLGDYTKAIGEYSAVLKIGEETGNSRLLMMVLCNMGDVYNRLGDYNLSARYLNEAVAFSRKIGSAFWHAAGMMHLGFNSIGTGNWVEAKGFFDEAYELAKRIGDREKEVLISLGLARVKENKQEALGELKSLYRLAGSDEKLNTSETPFLRIGLLLSELEFESHNYEEARKYLEEGFAQASKRNDMEFIFEFCVRIAVCYDVQSISKSAREYLKRASRAFLKLLDKIPQDVMRHYKMKPTVKEFLDLVSKYRLREKTFKEERFNGLFPKNY